VVIKQSLLFPSTGWLRQAGFDKLASTGSATAATAATAGQAVVPFDKLRAGVVRCSLRQAQGRCCSLFPSTSSGQVLFVVPFDKLRAGVVRCSLFFVGFDKLASTGSATQPPQPLRVKGGET
jgi:hypothetical protein